MAQTELKPASEGKTKRRIPKDIRIDMTPMVDLGFLLITFFIFTTTMAEEKTMTLTMPKKDTLDSTDLAESKALTVLLSENNQVFVYEGRWEKALGSNRVLSSSYNEYEGIGKAIRMKQERLRQKNGQDGRQDLVVLIKPAANSSYKNLIDALDEAVINDVKKYVVMDLSAEENAFLERYK